MKSKWNLEGFFGYCSMFCASQCEGGYSCFIDKNEFNMNKNDYTYIYKCMCYKVCTILHHYSSIDINEYLLCIVACTTYLCNIRTPLPPHLSLQLVTAIVYALSFYLLEGKDMSCIYKLQSVCLQSCCVVYNWRTERGTYLQQQPSGTPYFTM